VEKPMPLKPASKSITAELLSNCIFEKNIFFLDFNVCILSFHMISYCIAGSICACIKTIEVKITKIFE
jgi:hypothetical protein